MSFTAGNAATAARRWAATADARLTVIIEQVDRLRSDHAKRRTDLDPPGDDFAAQLAAAMEILRYAQGLHRGEKPTVAQPIEMLRRAKWIKAEWIK